jgi:Uma2 family endonuclease
VSAGSQLESPPLPVRRFTPAEYHQLVRAGLFDDERVELLEGWIALKMTRNPPHDAVANHIRSVIARALPRGWHVRVQSALTTADSEPEPDLAIVKGQELDYMSRHPGPADTALVVEVADSSIERDRTTKVRLYARAGIRRYWIVNLVDRCVEVYGHPEAGAYRERTEHRAGEITIEVPGADSAVVAVSDLLPA